MTNYSLINLLLFYSEENNDIIISSLCLLTAILKVMPSVPEDCNEDFLVNLIKLVLCILSKNGFSQDTINKVTNILEKFLSQMSIQICKTKKFPFSDKDLMQLELEVCIVYF